MNKALTGMLALLCLLVTYFSGKAQYSITPIAPPPTFTFNDLWHFTVVRGTSDAYTQFYVSMRIFEGPNHQLNVKSNSVTLTLAVGSQYYNGGNISLLQPFTTSYYNATLLQQAISMGGQFPPGSYTVTYTLYGKAADGEFTPLAEESIEAVIDLMWPPILLWPEDNDTIADPYPPLSWTPAFSSSYTGQITYTLNMVELLTGQSAKQAIVSNPSFFTTANLVNTFYPYGASAPALVNGKTYVWQVMATLGSASAMSQVWQFTYATTQLAFVFPGNLYTPVTKTLDGGYHLAKNKMLKIKYVEEYELPNNSYLLYNIYDKHGKKIRSSLPPMNSPSATVKKGENYITLSLGTSGLNLSSVDDYYVLEVMNHKNEKWYLRFKMIVSEDTPQGPNQ